MPRITICIPLSAAIFVGLFIPIAAADEATDKLYQQHCASCHGIDRLGGIGPALLPENLSRLRKNKAFDVIANGRAASQMLGFKEQLSAQQIQQLVDLVYTPLDNVPQWGENEIAASHVVHVEASTLADKPVFEVGDLLNMFIVVETGDHHATLLDGDTFAPIHRFPTRFALHGGPKFTADGRYVFFASRDGWISKFDIYNLKTVAEIRAGINTRNLAVSGDGRYVLVGNYLPHTVVVLSAKDLSLLKIIPAADRQGNSSRVSAVYTAAPRYSFIVALKDIKEVWEISYSDNPPPGFSGWVHDYRKDSGDVLEDDPPPADRFPIRRISVDNYLDDFFMTQDYSQIVGATRDSDGQVVDLDLGRVFASLTIPGMPHLGSGITWEFDGRDVVATPNLREGKVSIIDMKEWNTIREIETLGPGFFMRSHEQTPYAWVDVFFGEHKDALHVIDKQSLEVVKTLRPEPGKTAAHVEFTRDGRYALVSIWENDGALVIYNAETLEEVTRLPMKKPSGKYNIFNKISLSAGTSH